MRFAFFLILLLETAFSVNGQRSHLKVHYQVRAQLDEVNKSINGDWQAVVTNQADSAIHTIWIQLYPNAFSSEKTPYGEELLKWGMTGFYFAKPSKYGFIDSLQFQVEDGSHGILKQENRAALTVLTLNRPLMPGDSVRLSTTFFTQLPFNFHDNGYKGNVFTVKAWMPLIALMDEKGWHGEAYSLFTENTTNIADFDIRLDLPANYRVETNATQSAAGIYRLQNSDRFVWRAYPVGTDMADQPPLSRKAIPLADIATHLYPLVFHSGKSPADTVNWLGNVYQTYHRSVPFTTDSLFYLKEKNRGTTSLKPAFLYDFRHTDTNRYLFLSPAVGFNNYDKWMAGLLVHNYQLPAQPFSFAVAPMYAFGSKKITGGAHLEYNIWNRWSQWSFGLSGLTYSRRDFDIPNYPKFYQNMVRIVPSVNLTLFKKDANSRQKWVFGLRSFLLREQNYTSNIVAGDTTYSNVNTNTTLFEARAKVEEDRKLYPYSLEAVADQGKSFLRIGITGKYFFNYDATNKGVSARLFAGKFFYLKEQNFWTEYNNQRYNLTLSGPVGSTDYTYSDYFIGRNESTGWMSQQLMERDGFFKVSTLRLNGMGLSDNWLSALNLAADLPDVLNPLRVLPFKVPLKLFFDVGTYADLWSDVPPAGRFLYDFGIQVPLCHSLVNVYVPVLYSKVFRDTYRSIYPKNYFWRTISFNINLDVVKKKSRLIY